MQCKNEGVSSINGINTDTIYFMTILMVKMVPVTTGTKLCRIMIQRPTNLFQVISAHWKTGEGAFSCSVSDRHGNMGKEKEKATCLGKKKKGQIFLWTW